jgi:hypothetical protein
MFRQSKEEGYEVVAITLAALLIFSTLFLAENRSINQRTVHLLPEDSGSVTQPTVAIPEESDAPSDTKEVASTAPISTIQDIVSTTTRSVDPTLIPGTTFPEESQNVNSEKVLDDLQIDACAAADERGVCRTKLYGLGIVDIDDCCKYLGRCCG